MVFSLRHFLRLAPDRAHLYAAATVVALLSIPVLVLVYQLYICDDQPVLLAHRAGKNRTPMLGALAALLTDRRRWSACFFPTGRGPRDYVVKRRQAPPLASAFMLLTLVHVVETGNSLRHGRTIAQPSRRLLPAINPTGVWRPPLCFVEPNTGQFKPALVVLTTPYLSVLLADFKPKRLAIDPNRQSFLVVLRHSHGQRRGSPHGSG